MLRQRIAFAICRTLIVLKQEMMILDFHFSNKISGIGHIHAYKTIQLLCSYNAIKIQLGLLYCLLCVYIHNWSISESHILPESLQRDVYKGYRLMALDCTSASVHYHMVSVCYSFVRSIEF